MQGQAVPHQLCPIAAISDLNSVASSCEVVGRFVIRQRSGMSIHITEHGEALDAVLCAHALKSYCCVSNLTSAGKFHGQLRLVCPL